MTRADDSLQLLQLAADIARAGRDPGRWPAVLAALRDCLTCPGVLAAAPGEVAAGVTAPADAVIAALSCARDGSGACGQGRDVRKQALCGALLDHAQLALDLQGAAPRLRGHFDALSRPIFLIDADRTLLDTNREGRAMLASATWLTLADDRVRLSSAIAHSAFVKVIARLAAGPDGESYCQRLQAVGAQWAELWIRRLRRDEDPPLGFVVSLIVHGGDTAPVGGERLSPRQHELARHLHAGRTLAEAAERMGIARRTAKDHLTGLFRLSHTNRQADLLAWLTRQHLN